MPEDGKSGVGQAPVREEAGPRPRRIGLLIALTLALVVAGFGMHLQNQTYQATTNHLRGVDREALRAMETQDLALMDALPRYRMQGATGEVLSWLACAGASGKLQMELVDYIPAYRSAAGTGCGLAFALWQ